MTKQISTEQQFENFYRTLVANLIGGVDRTHEIYSGVKPDTMPDGMETVKDVFDAVLRCSNWRQAPTADNIIFGLKTSYGYEESRAELVVNTILKSGTEDRDIHNISTLLAQYLYDKEQRKAWKTADRVIEDGHGSIESRISKAYETVNAARQKSMDGFVRRTDKELAKHMMETQRRRTALLKGGMPPGPSLKYREFVGTDEEPGLVPHLVWGDSTLVTGKSKIKETEGSQD